MFLDQFRFGKRKNSRIPKTRPATALQVERLEDRTLLSAGALDTSYGTGGSTALNFGLDYSILRTSVIQPDGKILVAGSAHTFSEQVEFGLDRLNTDGSLDTTFGTGGRVVTDIGPGRSEIWKMLINSH